MEGLKIRLLIDLKSKRPYCPIMQALYGGDHHAVSAHIDGKHWIISLPDQSTEDPRLVSGTPGDWKKLNDLLNKKCKE